MGLSSGPTGAASASPRRPDGRRDRRRAGRRVRVLVTSGGATVVSAIRLRGLTGGKAGAHELRLLPWPVMHMPAGAVGAPFAASAGAGGARPDTSRRDGASRFEWVSDRAGAEHCA